MNVLSLFDGCSGGQEAFRQSNININNYYAFEINEDAIKITQNRFPNTKQMGDVESLIKLNKDGDIIEIGAILKQLPKIDVLIGGSPCQGISRSKTGKLDLKDPRSKLFFNYVEIKKWLIKYNNPNLIWLLENVVPNIETLSIMNNSLETDPYLINSANFTAQDRERLYWTNINVDMSCMPTNTLTIKDIMQENHNENILNLIKQGYEDTVVFGSTYMKWDTSGWGYYSQQNRARYMNEKMNTLTKSNGGDKTRIYLGKDNNGIYYRNASVEELELLQGLPIDYTNAIKSKGKRRGIIGDGWTIPVISWILSFIDM